MAIQYPFIASNRNFKIAPVQGDYQSITADGSLTYLDSTPPYDQNKPVDYSTWIKKIIAVNPGRIMIFIHGFANPWSKVIDTTDTGLAGMVSHFTNSPAWVTKPYLWPIILFDWPSYFAYDKTHPCGWYYSAKTNATNTAKLSFGQLKKIIDDIQSAKPGTKVDIICHSMGNFVFQQSMQPGGQPLTVGSVSTFLLNAAAIAADSFVKGSTKTPAIDIYKYLNPKGSAHVLWSQHDDVLPDGEICDRYKELGLYGPASGSSYVINNDLSSIVTSPPKGGAPSVHVSYYFIKEVLDQMINMMVVGQTTGSPTSVESETVHSS